MAKPTKTRPSKKPTGSGKTAAKKKAATPGAAKARPRARKAAKTAGKAKPKATARPRPAPRAATKPATRTTATRATKPAKPVKAAPPVKPVKPSRPAKASTAARAAKAVPPAARPAAAPKVSPRALPAIAIGQLGARDKAGSTHAAPHGAGFLAAWQAAAPSPLSVRAIYGADRVGAVHGSGVAALSFALAARPSAPDGAGFAALAAYEDELGEIVACPLSFDGMLLPRFLAALSAGETISGEPAVAASEARFWVAYSGGAGVDLVTLNPYARRSGDTLHLHAAAQAGKRAAHRLPRLVAAHGGVGVSFTVSTIVDGAGAYFAFVDEEGHASPVTRVSETLGDTHLAGGVGGFVATVQRVTGHFDVVSIAPSGARTLPWHAETLATDVPGTVLAVGAGEVLATAAADAHAHTVIRYGLDGKKRGTIELAHPVRSASRGGSGWLFLLADGATVYATLHGR